MNWRTLLLSAALYVPLFSMASWCVQTTLDLALGRTQQRSEWHEWSESGKRLLWEEGDLSGERLALAWQCDRASWELVRQNLQGVRSYHGQTQNGIPALSSSAIAEQKTDLQAAYALAQTWSVLVRLSDVQADRNIASVGNIQGYPEKFHWNMGAVGVQWKQRWDAQQFSVALWSGRSRDAAMTLYYPGYEPQKFSPGALTQQTLALQWRMYFRPDWYVQTDWSRQNTTMQQSEKITLIGNGVPNLIAYQPRVTMQDTPLTLSIGYRF
jgi:hypothetical protein